MCLVTLFGPRRVALHSMAIMNLAQEIAWYLPNSDRGSGVAGSARARAKPSAVSARAKGYDRRERIVSETGSEESG